MKSFLILILTSFTLISCYRTDKNKYEISSIEIYSFRLCDFEYDGTRTPRIDYRISLEPDTQNPKDSVLLVLVKINKNFVKAKGFIGTVPFDGMDGPNDSLQMDKLDLIIEKDQTVYKSNEISDFNILFLEYGTITTSKGKLGFSFFKSIESINQLETLYNEPNEKVYEYYSIDDICIPFVMSISQYHKLLNLNISTSKRNIEVTFHETNTFPKQ
ncbi:MAG: hypothetical protein H6600_06745 [Flavobacteriales bacterium]|nr:hypothetical protein [Flavobacteriales bacterium]